MNDFFVSDRQIIKLTTLYKARILR